LIDNGRVENALKIGQWIYEIVNNDKSLNYIC